MFPEIQQAGIPIGQEIQDKEVVIRGRSGSTRCLMSIRFISEELGKVSGTAIILNKMERVHKLVHRMVGAQARFRFSDIIGEDWKFGQAVSLAKNAAGTSLKVLLQGESGTGKELFAEAIHNASLWRDGPFVAVNCAAVPRDLIESELFGYEEGAFTGARKGGKPGRFELAEKGTLFLDEVESMPLEMQPKLLRVLEDGQIVRVGGSEVIPVDVRVIAATNLDLATEVKNGNFRADLLYRLNSVTINIPPLRERLGDIPLFVEHFLRKAATALMKVVSSVERKALNALCSYSYPGNVRELENIIERAVLVAQSDKLTLECLPVKVLQNESMTEALKERRSLDSSKDGDLGSELSHPVYCLSDLEKNAISIALKKTGGNISRAAKILGLGRNTLYRKIKEFRIPNVA
jgi:transcriptional regulator with PAS, ATPase and Fis domain